MPLSDLQVRVASIVLAVPEAAGFALAGGAALIFYEVTDSACPGGITSVRLRKVSGDVVMDW